MEDVEKWAASALAAAREEALASMGPAARARSDAAAEEERRAIEQEERERAAEFAHNYLREWT